MIEDAGAFIEQVDAIAHGDPQVVMGVCDDRTDIVVMEGLRQAVAVMVEDLSSSVEPVHAGGQGTDPELSFRVLAKTHYPVIGQTAGVVIAVPEMRKGLAVETVQPAKIGPD